MSTPHTPPDKVQRLHTVKNVMAKGCMKLSTRYQVYGRRIAHLREKIDILPCLCWHQVALPWVHLRVALI